MIQVIQQPRANSNLSDDLTYILQSDLQGDVRISYCFKINGYDSEIKTVKADKYNRAVINLKEIIKSHLDHYPISENEFHSNYIANIEFYYGDYIETGDCDSTDHHPTNQIPLTKVFYRYSDDSFLQDKPDHYCVQKGTPDWVAFTEGGTMTVVRKLNKTVVYQEVITPIEYNGVFVYNLTNNDIIHDSYEFDGKIATIQNCLSKTIYYKTKQGGYLPFGFKNYESRITKSEGIVSFSENRNAKVKRNKYKWDALTLSTDLFVYDDEEVIKSFANASDYLIYEDGVFKPFIVDGELVKWTDEGKLNLIVNGIIGTPIEQF